MTKIKDLSDKVLNSKIKAIGYAFWTCFGGAFAFLALMGLSLLDSGIQAEFNMAFAMTAIALMFGAAGITLALNSQLESEKRIREIIATLPNKETRSKE